MSHTGNTLSASLPTILLSRPFHPCVWPPDPRGYPGITPIARNPLSVYTEWKAAEASLGNSLPNSSKYFLLQKCSCENHQKDLEAFLSGVTKRQRMDQVPPDLFCLTYTVFFLMENVTKKKSRFPDCTDYQGNVVTRGPVFTWQQQAGDSSFLLSGPAFFHLPHCTHLPTSPQCPVTGLTHSLPIWPCRYLEFVPPDLTKRFSLNEHRASGKLPNIMSIMWNFTYASASSLIISHPTLP